jgi:putative membrane protein
MALVLVGIGRLVWGLKGWEFYLASWSFWAKMAAFAAVGIASIPPTLKILAWRRAARTDPAYAVPDADVAGLRRLVLAELALFTLIPVFAAMMARGIGS